MAHNNLRYGRLTNMEVNSSSLEHIPVLVSTLGTQKREEICRKFERIAGKEIVMGILAMLLGIIILVLHYSLSRPLQVPEQTLASGIWCGAFLLVTGILGVKVKKNPSLCMYNANLVMSILTALAMAVLMAFSIMEAVSSGMNYHCEWVFPLAIVMALSVVSSCLALIGLVGMVISIVHSVYCCKGVCCLHNEPQVMIVQGDGNRHRTQQTVQLADGRFVLSPTESCQEYVDGTSILPSEFAAMPLGSSSTVNGEKEASPVSMEDPASYNEDPNSDSQLLIA